MIDIFREKPLVLPQGGGEPVWLEVKLASFEGGTGLVTFARLNIFKENFKWPCFAAGIRRHHSTFSLRLVLLLSTYHFRI
jgi:hypothetical protein